MNKLYEIRNVFGLMLCVFGVSLTLTAAPSDLDPDFGSLGKVISAPNGSPTFTTSGMALQADGKIVIGGNRVISGAYAGMIVARYNADGSLDTTFNNTGWNNVTFGETWEFSPAVAIQADGKIVIGGSLRHLEGNVPYHSLGFARFNANGSLDTTFDGDGKVVVDFDDFVGLYYHEYLSELKVGSDGKIVGVGQALNAAVENRFILVRISANGSLDTTFGTNGKLADITGGRSNYDSLNDMVILPDGKIVVAGKAYGTFSSNRVVIKYDTTGGREWTFTLASPSYPNPPEDLNGIAVQPDGKFVVVGKGFGKVFAMRLNADGTQDTTFANGAGQTNGQALSVAVHADGKIVATIESDNFFLVRYNANGSLDSSFGNGGFVTTDLSSGGDYTAEILFQPDGKILVGGTSQFGSPTGYYISMVRYLGGSVVTYKPLFDFDGDSKADVSVFRPSENKWYILRSFDFVVWQQVFAIAGDVPVPADYDGDGKTDIAIFRPSTGDWWSRSSINGSQVYAHWGASGDIPRPSDFDGDGRSDYVVFRPSNNFWYRISSFSGATSNAAFGISGDKPVIGDFDGDGKSDKAIYRPSTGDWWWQSSVNGAQLATHWGISTDIPAPADFDGDLKTDFAVYRPSTGTWYVYNSGNNSSTIMNFGIAEDKPVPADYDGDGKADIAVFRPSTGAWYIMRTTAGMWGAYWGVSTDTPVENAFIP